MKKLILVLLIVLLPVVVWSKTVTATFTYDMASVDGFKLYDNGVLLCASTDPTIRSMVCEADLGFGAHSFTMTAYSGEEESPQSTAFPMVITISTPGLGSVTVED